MQYALLIYENEAIYGPEKSGAAIQQIVAKHMAFSQELGAQGTRVVTMNQLYVAVAMPGVCAANRIASSSHASAPRSIASACQRSQYGSHSWPTGRSANRHGALASGRLAITPRPWARAASRSAGPSSYSFDRRTSPMWSSTASFDQACWHARYAWRTTHSPDRHSRYWQ